MPKLAEGHAALSYRKYLDRDWLGAEVEIQRAIQLNPNYPMGHKLVWILSFFAQARNRRSAAGSAKRRGTRFRIFADLSVSNMVSIYGLSTV